MKYSFYGIFILMKLYHGSNKAVENPQILSSDRKLDFGTGFYLTSSYEQAAKWAELTQRRRGTGVRSVTVFDFDETKTNGLTILKFEVASVEWLRFVTNNRNNPDFIDNSDLVIGPVANDRTMPVIRLYFAGIYDEEETVKRLLPQKLTDQFTFKTNAALKLLHFSSAEVL